MKISTQQFKGARPILSWVLIAFLYVPTVLVFYFAVSREHVPLEEYASVRLIVLLLFMPIIVKYGIQLFVAPLYSVVENFRAKKRPANYNPFVSVVIPAWNEEVGIVKTIESVLNTKYQNLELIIVNDGSDDDTHRIITSFIERYKTKKSSSGITIQYRELENGGKARAMNEALKLAKHEIIITVDADCIMDVDAIKNIVPHFVDSRVASVAGNVVIGNNAKTLGFIQQLEYMYGFYFKRADSLFNSVYIVGGAAAAYRKDIIISAGGFDENIITEDIELSTRLQGLGYHVRYAHNSIVYTEGPADFTGLCQQRLRWKFGRLLTFYKHRQLFFSFKPGHKFYLSFLLLPVALFAETLLFFEGILLAVFFTYTIYTNDYAPLAFVIVLLTAVISLQVVTDPKIKHHKNLLLLAPVAWLLFYFMDLVEYQALVRSMKKLMSKSELKWQRWRRLGVFSDVVDGV